MGGGFDTHRVRRRVRGAPGGTPNTLAPRGRGGATRGLPVMLHAWRRRADPPLLPVRTIRTSRTNNAELRAGTGGAHGGAPGRGSGGSRDPRLPLCRDGHDCRDPRRHDCRPAAARGRGGGRGTAGPRGSAERRRGARTNRNRIATEATPGTRAARGTASRTATGPRATPRRAGRDPGHRNYTLLVINLLYSNVQLRTAQCTSRSPIQASSPDS